MCRIAFGTKNTLEMIPKLLLKKIFHMLEMSRGGDGNGWAGTKVGSSKLFLSKGVNVSVDHIVDDIYSNNPDLWIFHTRKTTIGNTSYENTHPHICKDNKGVIKGVLAQNGTINSYLLNFLENLYGGSVDVMTVSNFLFKIGKDYETVLGSLGTSIWILLLKDSIYCVNSYKWNKGDLYFYKDLNFGMSEDLIKDLHATHIHNMGSIKIYSNRNAEIIEGKQLLSQRLLDYVDNVSDLPLFEKRR